MSDDDFDPSIDDDSLLMFEQVAKAGRGPRLEPPPRYVPPEGIPQLDDVFEEDMGPPVDKHDANARKFFRDNPRVWEFMVRGSLYFLGTNQNFGFKMLVEVARFKHMIRAHDDSAPFKISNSYTSHLSRYMRYFYPPIKHLINYHG